jgi:hypothetical protein
MTHFNREGAVLTYMGALSCRICVPESWTDEQAVALANEGYPAGTEAGWVVRKQGDPLLQGDPERVSCEGHAGYVHIMLDA